MHPNDLVPIPLTVVLLVSVVAIIAEKSVSIPLILFAIDGFILSIILIIKYAGKTSNYILTREEKENES